MKVTTPHPLDLVLVNRITDESLFLATQREDLLISEITFPGFPKCDGVSFGHAVTISGACVDTRLSLRESLFVIQAHVARPNPICQSIVTREQDAAQILRIHYGRGLCFLIRRHCGKQNVEFFNAVIEASVNTIRALAKCNDEDLPRLIRDNFHQIARGFPRASEVEGIAIPKLVVNNVRAQLGIFAPAQFEALSRFYVDGESATAICAELNLPVDRFHFIRLVAKLAVGVSIEIWQRTAARNTRRASMLPPSEATSAI